MERDKNVKVIGLIALIIAVVSLTVAYAALSTTLRITGTATVNNAKWDVHFIAGSFSHEGSGTNSGNPTVNNTSITNLKAVLTKPGDSLTYTFQVTNAGSLPAKLNTFTKGAPSCSGGNDATATCQDLEYIVKYSDGEISTGAILSPGASKTVQMTIRFKANATKVPSHAVTVNGMNVQFVYNQQ